VSGTFRRVAVGAGAVLALAMTQSFVAAPARASGGSSTVYVAGSTVYFQAAPNAANHVTIKLNPDDVRVADDAGVIPGQGCVQVQAEVSCDRTGVTSVSADLGDLNDALGVRGTLMVVARGGPGDDILSAGDYRGVLYGDDGNDTLIGSPGADSLYGGPGNDTLKGEDGDDVLLGGSGADVVVGGPGKDTASYADHTDPVTADADSATSDDGSFGEHDTIMADVEVIIGGSADDLLIGGPGADSLFGGPGDDILIGGAGSDMLFGDAGFDQLYGDFLGVDDVSTDYDVCVVGPDGGRTRGCETVR
jgi:Ca2+-binding RTX toxin-like protein